MEKGLSDLLRKKVSKSAIVEFQAQIEVVAIGLRAAHLVDSFLLTLEMIPSISTIIDKHYDRKLFFFHDLVTEQTFLFNLPLLLEETGTVASTRDRIYVNVSSATPTLQIETPSFLLTTLANLHELLKEVPTSQSYVIVTSTWQNDAIFFSPVSSISPSAPVYGDDGAKGVYPLRRAWPSLAGWLLSYLVIYVQLPNSTLRDPTGKLVRNEEEEGNCLGTEELWLVRGEWRGTQFLSFSVPARLIPRSKVLEIAQHLALRFKSRLLERDEEGDGSLRIWVQDEVAVLDRVAL
ncbi:hypothetical protein BT69DRAFT_1348769 [Atractiella rhizophila]|nr:hypothetical protein BT69DRAFT_1348769 [Atractiella rhizophila]